MYMAKGMLACLPLEAARLDPEGCGAARGGCFNPPQYRPETNLLVNLEPGRASDTGSA